jgi:hypothetical protein
LAQAKLFCPGIGTPDALKEANHPEERESGVLGERMM